MDFNTVRAQPFDQELERRPSYTAPEDRAVFAGVSISADKEFTVADDATAKTVVERNIDEVPNMRPTPNSASATAPVLPPLCTQTGIRNTLESNGPSSISDHSCKGSDALSNGAFPRDLHIVDQPRLAEPRGNKQSRRSVEVVQRP